MKLIICLALISGICNAFPNSVAVHKLLNGHEIPSVGFGTSRIDLDLVEKTVTTALEIGYKHIDTSFNYFNEKQIGEAFKKWFARGNAREDVFITAKLEPQSLRASDIESALNLTLNNLGLDYVDMYLIHTPFGMERTADFNMLEDKNGNKVLDFSTDLLSAWRALEKQVKAGRVKSLGLSNFNATQVLRIWNFAEIKPSNLEIEANVYIQQKELRKLCQDLGIVVTGYSPLGTKSIKSQDTVNLVSPIEHPVIVKIAEAHKKTAAQVLLRFDLQLNLVIIPKSQNPKRMKENLDVFDFHLSEEEMKAIESLDQHGKYRKFDFLAFAGVENHPEYPFTDRIHK